MIEALVKAGRLSFVDLAGSERADRTGNVGARLKYASALPIILFIKRVRRIMPAQAWYAVSSGVFQSKQREDGCL